MFMDEMRFGLMSNYLRSWSKVGKRTVIANQQEYANRYLYSAIDPITGDNFHLIGLSDVNAMNTKIFLEKLKDEYKNYHIILIWDNAPFHRKKELHEIENLTPIFLPPYSPNSIQLRGFTVKSENLLLIEFLKTLILSKTLLTRKSPSGWKIKIKIKNYVAMSGL